MADMARHRPPGQVQKGLDFFIGHMAYLGATFFLARTTLERNHASVTGKFFRISDILKFVRCQNDLSCCGLAYAHYRRYTLEKPLKYTVI